MTESADFLTCISEIERMTAEVGIEAKHFTSFLVLDILFDFSIEKIYRLRFLLFSPTTKEVVELMCQNDRSLPDKQRQLF